MIIVTTHACWCGQKLFVVGNQVVIPPAGRQQAICTCKLSSDNVPCLYTQLDRITSEALGSLKWVAKPSGTCVEKLAKMFPASKTVPLKRPDVFDPLEDCVALPA